MERLDLSEDKRNSQQLSRLDVDTANRSIDITKRNSISMDKDMGVDKVALVV